MGQQANSGRRASLDDRKERAGGRQQQRSPGARAVRDGTGGEDFAKGRTTGAFGKSNRANARGTGGGPVSSGGGGGGGNTTGSSAAPMDMKRSSRPAKKR
jgi:hypothetical protein